MQAPEVLRTPVAFRWSDIDLLGHVHNAKYLEYLEGARVDLMEDVFAQMPGTSMVVARHEIDYLVPITIGALPIEVVTTTAEIRNSAFVLQHLVQGPAGVHSRARSTMVCIDPAERRSVRIPEVLRARLERYLDNGKRDGDGEA